MVNSQFQALDSKITNVGQTAVRIGENFRFPLFGNWLLMSWIRQGNSLRVLIDYGNALRRLMISFCTITSSLSVILPGSSTHLQRLCFLDLACFE